MEMEYDKNYAQKNIATSLPGAVKAEQSHQTHKTSSTKTGENC